MVHGYSFEVRAISGRTSALRISFREHFFNVRPQPVGLFRVILTQLGMMKTNLQHSVRPSHGQLPDQLAGSVVSLHLLQLLLVITWLGKKTTFVKYLRVHLSKVDSNLFPTGLIGFHTSLKSLADPLDCRYSSSASPAQERVNEPFGSISSFSRFSMVRKVRDTATKE